MQGKGRGIEMKRRDFIGSVGAVGGLTAVGGCRSFPKVGKRPNVVFVFADQWRASATGYAGNPDVKTPNLDRLAAESCNFKNAVSCCPVCSPARASLITGQYPLTHGVFVNDVCLQHRGPSIADCFNQAGYRTGYIGKWHLDGHGRNAFIPSDRRQGFQFWKTLECTHNYNESPYYDNENPELKQWDGYDAYDQTSHAIDFIQENAVYPFMLFLSWGPPHSPYLTAPEKFQSLYDPETLTLQPNVPEQVDGFLPASRWSELPQLDPSERARHILAGYYAHCSALDACIGRLQTAIRSAGLEENTIFVFTSDHGDMLGSQGLWQKQWPYDESIRVPLLLKFPPLEKTGCKVSAPVNTPDLFPTLCELCDVPVPSCVEGHSLLSSLCGSSAATEAALIANYHPFGQWNAARGGKEWRGVRTARYTYVKDLNGPWLLFDNQVDPYQMNNLINQMASKELQAAMEQLLRQKLDETGDSFEPGMNYVHRWKVAVDESGTVKYSQ